MKIGAGKLRCCSSWAFHFGQLKKPAPNHPSLGAATANAESPEVYISCCSQGFAAPIKEIKNRARSVYSL